MSSPSSSSDPTPLEVPPWLKSLPLAPEYHPTLAEFADPISFILKIEKEASAFGICKIVPPLPPPPKKTTLANLNRSFAARDPSPKKPPTFTTRQQQIGFCPRRPRPVQKPVWQSGESYTLQQFEAKAKQFERSQMKKFNKKSPFSPLEVESLFWRACADKPFSVEYANDMPGSGFAPIVKKWCKEEEEAASVGESGWNMRGVSRAKGSLLRFMKEEIPGVTSPMVYVAMMFSWFAWHVEDHELHSLNYLHMGAGKTWYGVPRDAGLAFEDVVRVHGYGGEVNPLVTFTILGEKTTVMSPEVLVGAGIPCCRLVQNAGEFVVTFPGAYHSGFSHGFNCAEAANIATPGWLRVAKEAAIRRASINYPPMVSHFQLLYALALSLCSRMPLIGVSEPRSSRLKDKMRGEGEVMVKEIFIQNVIETNDLLSILQSKGSSCIVLPQKNIYDSPLRSNSLVRAQLKMKPRLSLGLCSREEALEASRNFPSNDVLIGRNDGMGHLNGLCALKGNSLSLYQASATSDKSGTSAHNSSASDSQHAENEKESAVHSDGLLDQGLLSCVTCGILSFTCVAVVHPREAASRYLMSADCGFLNDQNVGTGENYDGNNGTNWNRGTSDLLYGSGQLESHIHDRANDNLVHCSAFSVHVSDHSVEDDGSDAADQIGVSALDLLASAYGASSDSEGEGLPASSPCTDENNDLNHEERFTNKDLLVSDSQNGLYNEYSHCTDGYDDMIGSRSAIAKRCELKPEFLDEDQTGMVDDLEDSGEMDDREDSQEMEDSGEMETSNYSIKSMGEAIDAFCKDKELNSSSHTTAAAITHQGDMKMGTILSGSPDIFRQPDASYGSAEVTEYSAKTSPSRNFDTIRKNLVISAIERSDKDSSRMHVFCLEHALEVEKILHPFGGVNIMILCHPDYPKIEQEAKSLAEEFEREYEWKYIDFMVPTLKDQERIRAALEDEESMPTSSDWAVKLGINLYYSANLSKSPLYNKQMPYNAVIYRAFGCSSPNNSPIKPKPTKRKPGRQRKIVIAGKWCGKVWMANQVHPFLAHRKDAQEQEHAGKLHSEINSDMKPNELESEIRNKRIVSKKNSSGDNISNARRSAKRKKQPLVRATIKKPKCTPQVMNKRIKDSDTSGELSSVKSSRVLRSCRKLNAKYVSEDAPSTPGGSRKLTLKDEVRGGWSSPRSFRKSNVKDEEGGPSTRLRTRPSKLKEAKTTPAIIKKQVGKRKPEKVKLAANPVKDEAEVGSYACNVEGCTMSFNTKHDLALHKKDICPEEGCGKKFFSHKYLVQHRKVHMDDRPLECPWKGCEVRFKWAWARTEHIRVHTGDRPYICRECSQTFRFVSDFSRHKRKTGHLVKKGRR